MKSFGCLATLLTFSLTAIPTLTWAASPALITLCSATYTMPGKSQSIPTTFQIFNSQDKAMIHVSQVIEGESSFYEDTLDINEYAVRADLTAESRQCLNDLNPAESLISSTMEFLQTPDLGTFFTTGLNLKAIRSAKLYTIGKTTHMGATVIIEARDESGNKIGSFITGFLPYACESK